MMQTPSMMAPRQPLVRHRKAPSTWDLQIDGKRDGLSDANDYAAMATPVTSAQVAKAWVRPDRRLAAVSWSRRRGKTLATWSWVERKR